MGIANFFNRFLVGFTLAYIAVIILFTVGPAALIYSICKNIFTLQFNKAIIISNKLFMSIAHSIDQTGNVLCQDLFNDLLLKNKKIHKFGNADETISSVLGKNKKEKNLSFLGKCIDIILEYIDPNHTIKASENPTNN